MWSAYLYDTMSGLLGAKIDIPNFSWGVTVGDASFSSEPSGSIEQGDVSTIDIPWSALPAYSAVERATMLAPYKRGIAAFWKDPSDTSDSVGLPVVAGAIGIRTSTREGVSIPFISMMGLLGERYLAKEQFANDKHYVTGSTMLQGLSWRAIACHIIRACTSEKPGGILPIDLPYIGEKGTHQLPGTIDTDTNGNPVSPAVVYHDYDINSHSCASILTSISEADGGPDIQLRPYLDETGTRIRFRMIAGSDATPYLGQNVVHALDSSPWGGTLENITVAYDAPSMRVYAVGSGTDDGTLGYLAQDRSLLDCADSWPLRELTATYSGETSWQAIASRANGYLDSVKRPRMQLEGDINGADRSGGNSIMPPGSFWPGELFHVYLQDYPDLPDGVYPMRLMKMSGDAGSTIHVTFDICETPYG